MHSASLPHRGILECPHEVLIVQAGIAHEVHELGGGDLGGRVVAAVVLVNDLRGGSKLILLEHREQLASRLWRHGLHH